MSARSTRTSLRWCRTVKLKDAVRTAKERTRLPGRGRWDARSPVMPVRPSESGGQPTGTCVTEPPAARPPRLAAVSVLAFLLIAALPPLALAEEQTRASYTASVEPICKVNKQASDRYLNGVRSLVRRDRLKQASQRFTKAANALERTRHQLAAVPMPPEDALKLTRWLAGIRGEATLMRRIATKLRQGDKGQASSLSVRLTHDANTTNNLVIVFQFDYCRIDPTRYT